MNQDELESWFSNLKDTLEGAYLSSDEPWKQSGFSGPLERWIACRKPIADCIDSSGSFLDIGCANGYLLESVLEWTKQRGISIVPYGIDLSQRLVELAQERLPEYRNNICVGNGLLWNPPRRFDYVRTELCYVPEEFQKKFVIRVVDEFLPENGKLLFAEYRSRKDEREKDWHDVFLTSCGFTIVEMKSGMWEGKELTRIVVVMKEE
jgi:SAM-dependent methyltransferase